MSEQSLKPGWKMVKFGEVVKNANLVERDPEANDIERIVGLEHIDPENLHIRRWNSVADGTSFTRKFVPGQTLFGKRRAYQRKVAYAEFEGICSGDILTFEPKNRKVLLPELLPFICQSNAFFDHALGTSAGSLSPRTSWTALQDFEFPLPPIDEQNRIAEILWTADESIEKYIEAKSNLSKVARIKENDRFCAFVKLANEGLIPMVQLNDVLAEPISNGIFKKRDHFGSGTLLINVTDIYESFRVNPLKLERVNANAKEVNSFSAMPGDVIFNRSSLVFDGIGKACLVPDCDEPMVFDCHLMRARPDMSIIDARYLCRFSLSSFGRRYLISRAQTTTMTTINQGDLGKLPIPLPSLDEQMTLADMLDQIESELQALEHHIYTESALRKKLVNEFFGGAIHV